LKDILPDVLIDEIEDRLTQKDKVRKDEIQSSMEERCLES
jgi:hypothetical protein